jgi:hypothetical protein
MYFARLPTTKGRRQAVAAEEHKAELAAERLRVERQAAAAQEEVP